MHLAFSGLIIAQNQEISITFFFQVYLLNLSHISLTGRCKIFCINVAGFLIATCMLPDLRF